MPGQSSSASPCTFISYSREDSEFALRLAKDLKAAGAFVWLDQLDIRPGEPWDNAIEDALMDAPQMLIVLSPASARSENVRDEISFALGQGKVIIPVLYIECVVPLRLQRTQHIDFRADYARGINTLLSHLNIARPNSAILQAAAEAGAQRDIAWHTREAEPQRPRASTQTYPTRAERDLDEVFGPKLLPDENLGGAISADSRYYIVTPSDVALQKALQRRDSIIRISGAHQMGKGSLLARGLRHARQLGATTVTIDLQKVVSASFQNDEAFFRAIGGMIADQLDLEEISPDFWLSRRAPAVNFERYISRIVLPKVQNHLILAIDEADRLLAFPFGYEVFALFRSWHNERASDPDSPWQRVTLIVISGAEAHLFIVDPNQSPFNVGIGIEMRDFKIEEVDELNERYGRPIQSLEELKRFYDLFDGQRYLTQSGFVELQRSPSLDEFIAKADTDEGPFGEHLRGILALVTSSDNMAAAVKDLMNGAHPADDSAFVRLRRAGIVGRNSDGEARLRCGIYYTYLSRHLQSET